MCRALRSRRRRLAGPQPIPGSVEAIADLRAAGHRVLFVTNNSAARVEVQEAALAAIGIPADGDVLTSANAAALLIEPGERVLVCGGEGVVEAVAGSRRGRRRCRSDDRRRRGGRRLSSHVRLRGDAARPAARCATAPG